MRECNIPTSEQDKILHQMGLLNAATLKQPFATLSVRKEHGAEGRNSAVLPVGGGRLWITSSREHWTTLSSVYLQKLKERLRKWSSTPARAHTLRTFLGCAIEELTPKIAEEKFPRGRLVGEVVLGQMQSGRDLTDSQYRYAYPIHEARELHQSKQIFMEGSQGTWLAPEVLLRAIHENGVQDSTAEQLETTASYNTVEMPKTRKRVLFADDLENSWKTRRLRSAHAQSNHQSSTFQWPDPPKVPAVRNRRLLARASQMPGREEA